MPTWSMPTRPSWLVPDPAFALEASNGAAAAAAATVADIFRKSRRFEPMGGHPSWLIVREVYLVLSRETAMVGNVAAEVPLGLSPITVFVASSKKWQSAGPTDLPR